MVAKPPVTAMIILSFVLLLPATVLAVDASKMKIFVYDHDDNLVTESGFLQGGSVCSPDFPNAICFFYFYECSVYGDYKAQAISYESDGSPKGDPSSIANLWKCCDKDGDGYDANSTESGGRCDGDDCCDTDPDVNPGETENCSNGIDDDCNGFADSDDCACRGICGPGGLDPDSCNSFLCNGTYEMVCHYDNSENPVWTNRPDITDETNCGDVHDNDCDGLTDCEDHATCDGEFGPGGIRCCDPGDSGAQISSDCSFVGPDDNSLCVNETCDPVFNECQYSDRPQCDQTECGPDAGWDFFCNESGGFCRNPDQQESVCELCFEYVPGNLSHWDHQTGGLCCEYPLAGGPNPAWCNPFNETGGYYPDYPPGESCVDESIGRGVWYENHCIDLVNNCDEDPGEIDCGHGGGPPGYSSCGPCCEGCNCINLTLSTYFISTKTMVRNIVVLTFDNDDPIESHDVELYVENEEDLQTCFGQHCEAWEYYFSNATGDYPANTTFTIPALAAGANLANFTFIPSGPTPSDNYEIILGVRNPGEEDCPPIS